MALSANTVIEVRNGGSDTNGGGFVTGASGTDWSCQTAAQYSVTDGVTAGTTTITSASANFGTDVVGNLAYLQGGTGSVAAGWYQIISRTNSTTIVVDRSTGLTAGTGVTIKIGGALASKGAASAIATVAGMIVYVKYHATAFEASSASTNVSGGCILGVTGVFYVGYDTTRTIYSNDANKPTFKVASGLSSATLIAGTNATPYVRNMILDGNSQTSSRGCFHSGQTLRCKFLNFTNGGHIQNAATADSLLCEANGCTTVTAFNVARASFCEAHSCTFTPFSATNVFGCISYNNTGASTDGFGTFSYVAGSVASNNGRHGFNANNTNSTIYNSIAESNAGYGFFQNTNRSVMMNFATYNNTSGRSSSTVFDEGPITGSSSFFVDGAAGNFALNNTAGGGALCRAAGIPSSFYSGLTLSYPDIGAAQQQELGGGAVVPASYVGAEGVLSL